MTCWLCGFQTTELATNAGAETCKNGCQICTDVAKVDEEINQAVTTLRRLLKRRCDLRTEHNRAHDPMQRLPVEIRNRTFELVLPRWDEWGDTIQVEGEVVSHLSSVCRSWRDIAQSNPFLWSTIRIRLGQGSTSRWIDSVHNQIMRAGTSPLTFRIGVVNLSMRCLGQSRKDMAPVLDVMSRCSNRLQSLSLAVPLDTLRAFQNNNLHWHRLTQLRIRSLIETTPHLSLVNTTASPERIELSSISIRSLRISWNRLTSAKIRWIVLDDLIPLFQHASQMTECHISFLDYGPDGFTMPQIIHHRLKTFSLRNSIDMELAIMVLNSLTVPCLQELHISDMRVLNDLPELVRRSLTSLTLYHDHDGLELPYRFNPFPGASDLVVETPGREDIVIKRLLLEGCFPNLRRLTLRGLSFFSLWKMDVIPLLLDRKRLQSDGPNESRLSEILVIEQDRALEFDRMWKSDVGDQLKALGIKLRKDGFEFL